MLIEDYFEFWEPNDIRIKGHRIGIQSILHKYLAGQSAEAIARQYDTLRPLDIYATITYYLENQSLVDTYLKRVDDLIDAEIARSDAHPSPVALRLRRLRANGAATPA